ncbi:hypothetical_protein_-_conserved [Leishmania infantum]|uniref:Hypothetical_protein_-_conserved n=1 Tax=Leishmania infantum TaxID=5671 RepID=A0A6L0XKV4_LEIIN|nr:hypothetical_protein_-_conserved [Leishmania infantum]SUZ41264.1 hypothetical_protein_-_conserved [Leishmania infantum]
MLYCHHALVGTAATGCGRLACSCRTECEGVELGLDLLRTQHQRRRHRQSSVAAAAHSLSLLTTLRTGLTAVEDGTSRRIGGGAQVPALLACRVRPSLQPVSGPWELVHNDVAGTLAKPAMPGAPTPTAWIADPATGLTRQADSPRYGTTRCDTRSLPASVPHRSAGRRCSRRHRHPSPACVRCEGGIPGAVPGMLREIRGLLEARSVARFALWSCAQ